MNDLTELDLNELEEINGGELIYNSNGTINIWDSCISSIANAFVNSIRGAAGQAD